MTNTGGGGERCQAVLLVHAEVVPALGTELLRCVRGAGHPQTGAQDGHSWEREDELEHATLRAGMKAGQQARMLAFRQRTDPRRSGPDASRQMEPE